MGYCIIRVESNTGNRFWNAPVRSFADETARSAPTGIPRGVAPSRDRRLADDRGPPRRAKVRLDGRSDNRAECLRSR